MKHSVELKQKAAALAAEVQELIKAGKGHEAEEKAKEANNLYASAKAEELTENMTASTAAAPVNKPKIIDMNKIHNRAFNKAVFGRQMDDIEQAYANTLRDTIGTPGQAEGIPEKGGYLVPAEKLTVIQEYRRNRVALKDYCDVVTVSAPTGTAPTSNAETGKLINFDEISDINQNDISFDKIDWKLGSYGDIIPVSNELLADNDVDLMSFIARRMAMMGVNAENDKIFAIMSATTLTHAGTDYKAIPKALNTKLDADIVNASIIFTDALGFDYLDEAEDKNGRPLLTPSYADPAAVMFRGHPVVVLPSMLKVGSTDTSFKFIVGSPSDGIKFFDRQGVTIAADASAGFTQNKTLVRAIERFDVKAADAEAFVTVTITPATV